MEWEDDEKRRRAFLREYMKKDRYGHRDHHGRDRSSFMYRMEKLTHAYRRGKITREEYEMQKEMFREYVMRKGRYYEEFGMGMMWDEFFSRGMGRDDSSSSSDEEDERTEEKFAELEAIRRKWHQDLEQKRWQMVAATKNLVSDAIILQNDYNVDRIIGMSKDLQEPVFLTKMAYFAVKHGAGNCLSSLIKYGAWVNQPTTADENKYTPLHLACKKNDHESVKELTKARAKVDKLDTEGNSCLLMAMHYGCKEDIVKLLLRRTRSKSSFLPHVNKLGENLLHRCGPFFTDDRKRPEKRDNVKAYELILQKAKEKGEVQQLLEMRENTYGYTPIISAVVADSPEKVGLLMELGANPDVVANSGESAVHIASKHLYDDCLKKLLDGGASVGTRNQDGNTPIELAFMHYNPGRVLPTATVLLEHGAKVHSIVDKRRQLSIFHIAVYNQHHALVNLFCDYGASPLVRDSQGHRPIDVRSYDLIHEKLYEEATYMKSLSEICKWKIRDSIESGASLKTVSEKLPIPKHLKEYLKTKGHSKPHFSFPEETMDTEENTDEAKSTDEVKKMETGAAATEDQMEADAILAALD